jgi:BolA-like protein 1
MANLHSSEKVESHFHLQVSSPSFDGMGKVQRHRLIYGLLKEELKPKDDGGWGLHALQIVAKGSDGK